MTTVVEIEKALQTLPVEDARKIADWLQNYLDDKWDEQIDRDIPAGRLDKLADKAMQDYHAGQTHIASTHSVLDIAPVSVGKIIRALSGDDDLLGEMLEDLQ